MDGQEDGWMDGKRRRVNLYVGRMDEWIKDGWIVGK